MFQKIKFLLIPILASLMILSSCTKVVEDTDLQIELAEKNQAIAELILNQKELVTENVELEEKLEKLQEELDQVQVEGSVVDPSQASLGPSSHVVTTSEDVIDLIKNKDMANLALYVHPSAGLRFTPYFYIDTTHDQVFTAQEVAGLGQNTDVFIWGEYDGSGDPISLNFNDYYDKFIYDQDFINPDHVGNNTPIGSGNMIDNIDQAYPNGHYVEYNFEGFDPQYDGMDWESLRLVFEENNGLWYLVGVVHGQWTI